jgi:hypothetical protein
MITPSLLLKTIALVTGCFAAVWTFNHVNPWIGIGLGVAIAIYLLVKLSNKIQ